MSVRGDASVATVRCAACFHINLAEAPSCSGCGGELGLEPVGQASSLACPECKQPFEAFPGDGGAVHDCGRCGGQFVDHALLLDMLQRRERRGLARRMAGARPGERPVRYVPCPVCSNLLNRKNFGGKSGVVVDICKQHGTWFDRGELPRVLAFAEAGGLSRARARESEEHEAERRATAVRVGATLPRYDAPGPVLCDGTDVGERVVDLLGVVLSVAGLALDLAGSD